MSAVQSIRKLICGGGICLGLLAGVTHADVALAYWQNGGAGTSGSPASAHSPLRINQTAKLAAFGPGQGAQTLSGDFDNRNADAVRVATLRVSIASVTKAPGAAAGTCDSSDFTLAHRAMAVGDDVPSGRGTSAWTGATIEFNNKPGIDQNACMGATVKLGYTVS
jgi:hypothetical protein